ncbi:hypothetical protein [Szabonella alba]|uniref:Uncharacterized protein n=1 Tax=Szabonella alba TaxID=2804194 RepID=A0A8K0V9F0_9RHOB|nr:hypothetical protein [Szabonella alba]MBL4915815.1 hypothetical protein [Szabonella alba]
MTDAAHSSPDTPGRVLRRNRRNRAAQASRRGRAALVAGAVVLTCLAAPLRAGDAAQSDPAGAVWTGLLDACLALMDRRVLVPGLGKGWRSQGFGAEIAKGEWLRDYTHRPTGALAQLQHHREMKRVDFCGTSIFRHFPASAVMAATEGWVSAGIAAGWLTDTGRETGLGRDLEPVAGMVWTYQWCGAKGGAASIRLEMSEFPPARMDIYRNDDCAEES